MMRTFYTYFFILLSYFVCSQEATKPLGSNINYLYKDLKPHSFKPSKGVSTQKTSVAASIQIPFIEDFYYAPTKQYPDQGKWSDSTVYVNTGYPIAPPSIGVATFDGLNKNGYPYDPTLTNLTISKPADVLTSQPINLHTAGTTTLFPTSDLAISFYYQARGNGDNPELNDSLVLDFFRPYAHPDTAWKSVWFAQGSSNSNTNDSIFKRGFVRITDSSYFHDGFKFRFHNSASPTGNFDHWHLDYIFLDQNRGDSLFDTVRNDITFGNIPTPFLKNYSEMPYQQYNTSEMAKDLSVKIRNNGGSCVNMSYKYRIYDDTHSSLIFPEYDGGFCNLNSFYSNSCSPPAIGYSKCLPHARPTINNSFTLPPPERINYEIRHFVFLDPNSSSGSDAIKQNDTVIQYQFFRDFYSFDDGGAEAGYYIKVAGGKIAVKIQTNVLDTLRALRIYFDPVGNSGVISNSVTSSYNFNINIWSLGSNGGPGALLYRDSITYHPAYLKDGFKEIPEFKLKRPLTLGAGTYFMGIQQGADYVTVGLDRNNNFSYSTYYDSGQGWKQSTEPGSVMIRPLFSNTVPETVGIREISASEKNNFTIYPNPSSEEFTVRSAKLDNSSYQLFNSLGQLIKEDKIGLNEQTISVSDLNQGIYILVLKNKEQAVQQQKIIVQR